MITLQFLQEASQLPLASLRSEMLTNPITKVLFNKNLSISDIQNPAKFVASVKFLFLNNDNVVQFVKLRSNIKNLNYAEFSDLRTLSPSTLDVKLDHLKLVVSEVFKELNFVEKSGISAETKKELNSWINSNGTRFNFTSAAIKELKTINGIRPTEPIRLYRGILFSKNDMRNAKSYDARLEDGNGITFLSQIRDNKKIIDLEWNYPSSWTTNLDVATRFAKYGPAGSETEATFQWLQRGKKQIDGELGFVISTLARPEDILFSADGIKTSFHFKHGDENEVVLVPGKRLAKIVKKFTVSGEIDHLEHVKKIKEKTIQLRDEIVQFKDDNDFSELLDAKKITNNYLTEILSDEDLLKFLGSAQLTQKLTDSYVSWLKFAKKHLNFDRADAEDPAIKELIDAALTPVQAPGQNFKKLIDVPFENIRSYLGSYDELRDFERDCSNGRPRITDHYLANIFSKIYTQITNEPVSSSFLRQGAEKQAIVINPVIDFVNSIITPTSKETDRFKIFFNNMRRIYRNYQIYKSLTYVNSALEKFSNVIK